MFQGILHEEDSVLLFLLVTVAMGGWAGGMAARALARSWRPYRDCLPALLGVAALVRFIHFALFSGTLLSAQYFLVDALVVLAIGSASFRITRAAQMTTQYRWLYARTGPFTWRERAAETGRP
ncbi:DUF6867 family protein [Methylobacterium sp. Leaf118]|uniref:DUF6867 family protein n=1 Tax=Methylobacterium sp. Leaf118 TaxID=2876562 RepID=UPI001E3C2783|nr:hypothetical protein [Methylobacterium sp. Leaf118]